MARVDPLTPFNDFQNDEVCEKQFLHGSSFAREIIHFKQSNNFNPWTYLERYPASIGKHEVYMMYGQGPEFQLKGARLRIEMCVYDDTLTQMEVQDLYRVLYDEPFEVAAEIGNFVKKVVATIEIKEEDLGRDLLGFKVQLIGDQPDSLMKDFYWEGIAILKASGGFERKPVPQLCTIF